MTPEEIALWWYELTDCPHGFTLEKALADVVLRVLPAQLLVEGRATEDVACPQGGVWVESSVAQKLFSRLSHTRDLEVQSFIEEGKSYKPPHTYHFWHVARLHYMGSVSLRVRWAHREMKFGWQPTTLFSLTNNTASVAR